MTPLLVLVILVALVAVPAVLVRLFRRDTASLRRYHEAMSVLQELTEQKAPSRRPQGLSGPEAARPHVRVIEGDKPVAPVQPTIRALRPSPRAQPPRVEGPAAEPPAPVIPPPPARRLVFDDLGAGGDRSGEVGPVPTGEPVPSLTEAPQGVVGEAAPVSADADRTSVAPSGADRSSRIPPEMISRAKRRYRQAREASLRRPAKTRRPWPAAQSQASQSKEVRVLAAATDSPGPAKSGPLAQGVVTGPLGPKDARSRLAGTRRPLLAGFAALALVAAGVGAFLGLERPAKTTGARLAAPSTTSGPVTSTTTPTTQPPPFVELSSGGGTDSYSVSGSPLELTLSAVGRCWVELRQGSPSGPMVFTGILGPGQSRSFQSAQGLWLRLGYPPGMTMTVNGHTLPLPANPAPLNVELLTS